MRARTVFLLAAATLSACTLPVGRPMSQPDRSAAADEITAESETPTVTRTASPSSPPTVTATPTPTPTTTPPHGATSNPTPTTTRVGTPEPQRISFEPGAVSAAVEGRLNVERTYLVNARGGQVMTLYIDADDLDARFELLGTNGVSLREDSYQPFWRGMLPSSGDYRIMLPPNASRAPFRLSITINPRGVPFTWTTYALGDTGYQVDVPDDFVLQAESSLLTRARLPELHSLIYVDTGAFQGTNLRQAGLILGASPDLEGCLKPHPYERESGELMLDGIRYRVGVIEEAGGGEVYLDQQYRTADLGFCLEATSMANFTSMGAYAGTGVEVKPYDAQALEERMLAVLRSVRPAP